MPEPQLDLGTLERFVQLTPEPTLLIAGDGEVVAANAGARDSAGFGDADVRGRALASLVVEPPEKVERALRMWRRSRQMTPGALTWRGGGAPIPSRCDGAVIQPSENGGRAIILLRFRPKREATSRFRALNAKIEALTREIAERRRVEAALREQREWFEVTLSSIGDAVLATDLEGRVVFLNPVAARLTGWTPDEARSRPAAEIFNIVNEFDREPVESPVDRVLREGVVVGLANHTVLIRRDGAEVPIDDSGAPIRNDRGDLTGAVLVFRDISARHAADKAFRESEERFRLMADSAPVMIWISDTANRRTYFNRTWLEFTGRALEDELGDGWMEGVHPADAEQLAAVERVAVKRRAEFRTEYRLRRRDGRHRWMLEHGAARFDAEGGFLGFIGSCVDLSDHKRMEQALRESELRFRLMVESATDYAIFAMDLEGRVTSWNTGAERLLGWAEEDIAGKHAAIVFIPEDRERGHAEIEIRTALTKGRAENERWHIRKDGTRFWASGVIMPLRDEADRVHGLVKILRDHTDRKRAEDELRRRTSELARANEELDRSNRELEDFAYVASHDLKEPLRGIHNYTSFLLEDYGDRLNDDGREKLETLMRLSQRMNGLINTLLHYSRVGRLELDVAPVRLEEIVHEAVDSLAPFMESTGLQLRIVSPLPVVACDRISVGEVIANLLTNAGKYSDKQDRWVEIGVMSLAPGAAGADTPGAGAPEAPPGHVTIAVRDNGIGIRPQHLETVFRMFKRLHGRDEFGGGAGAGLTIVKKIIERHGGRVWIESEVGRGTTVFFTLPETSFDDQTAHSPGGRGQS